MSRRLDSLALLLSLASAVPAAAGEPVVVGLDPARNATAPAGAAISIDFDEPLDVGSVTSSSFRVFGRQSGTAAGTFSFSMGDQRVTFTPSEPFRAGEVVLVNLASTIRAADLTPLRSAGYAYQYTVASQPSAMAFVEIDEFTNKSGPQTRIYGAMASDLDNDGFTDLMTVNEVSADVRVFLNLGDGSGLFDTDWLTPQAIGVESSPNEQADFDNDGNTDAAIAATSSEVVSILLGAGDGTFSSIVQIPVGDQPHGVAVLDVDGDGDLDVANANRGGAGNLSLLLNDGDGAFGAPTFFDSGAAGEYGLAAGDMNGDGITDLVTGAIDGEEIVTLLGNGDGTFTPAPGQDSGGPTWVVVLADVNGDGDLDAVAANSFGGDVGVLLGNGDGTFAPPDTVAVGAHTPSVDVGDLDGDGDQDMLVSSFGGGFWDVHTNDGTGVFSFFERFTAVSSPSCSVLYDGDNDGDLDLALTDEIADLVRIVENTDGSTLCPPAPDACRAAPSKKSRLTIRDDGDDAKDRLQWKWSKGEATSKIDFGDPSTGEDYELCVYEDGALLASRAVPAGGFCAGKPCWKETATAFLYKDKLLSPAGIASMKLGAGDQGKARIQVKGRGAQVAAPAPGAIAGTLDVQLHHAGGPPCWGATFSPPFVKHDGSQLKAASD